MTTSRTLLTSLLGLLAGIASAADSGPLSRYDPPLTPAFAELLRSADPSAGARTFERKCSQCHDSEKSGGHAKGPFIWNVLGRQAGSSPGFDYSAAMKNSGHVWTYARLNYFLSDTERAVPGKAMNLVGLPDEKTRAEVIAFLRSLHDNPPPLP